MNGLPRSNLFDVLGAVAPTGISYGLSPKHLEMAAAMDIRYWRMLHQSCPSCGVEFEKCNPAMNLMPHWYGKCVASTERTSDISASTAKES